MYGEEAIDALRAKWKSVKIIMVCGRFQTRNGHLIDLSKTEGIDAFVSKTEFYRLTEVIESIM